MYNKSCNANERKSFCFCFNMCIYAFKHETLTDSVGPITPVKLNMRVRGEGEEDRVRKREEEREKEKGERKRQGKRQAEIWIEEGLVKMMGIKKGLCLLWLVAEKLFDSGAPTGRHLDHDHHHRRRL